jgi:hypothetical protein
MYYVSQAMYNVLEAFFIEIPSWEGTYPLYTSFLRQDKVIGYGFIIITIHQYLMEMQSSSDPSPARGLTDQS